MQKIIVIRHGETLYNIEGRYLGTTDIPLHKNGILQIQNICKELASLPIDVITTSPLLRARETAEIINCILKKPLYIHNEIRERALGIFEGLTKNEIVKNFPELWKKDITRNLSEYPPQGESIQEVEI